MIKKTILIVIQHYLPGTKTGGPVRSISNLVEWLGDEFNFYILTLNHDRGDKEPYSNIEQGRWYSVGKAQVRYLTVQEARLLNLRKIIRSTPHDLLHVESVLARTSVQVLLLRRLGQLYNTPVLLTPRGHLGRGALEQKSTKKAIFLAVAKLLGLYGGLHWYATSEEEKKQIIQHFGQQEAAQINVISNLPTPVMETPSRIRAAKQAGNLRIIFLSRIHSIKNLYFALETMRGLEGKIEFDIYGPIEDEKYWEECQRLIVALSTNVKVRYCGVVPFDQTVKVMSQYHLFYLPTLHENYGHVIWEALSAGCPVLISDQTPWKDLEVQGAGWSLPLDKPDDFKHSISQMVDLDDDQFSKKVEQVRSYCANYMGVSVVLEKLRQLFVETASNVDI